MIQRTSYNTLPPIEGKNIKEPVPNMTGEEMPSKANKQAIDRYKQDLSINPPTYTDDIKALMKKGDIEENSLNLEIVKTMDGWGVEVSKEAVDIIVQQLQKEHLFNLYEQGYNIAELTIDIIAKEIKISGDILIIRDEEEYSKMMDRHHCGIDKSVLQALIKAGLDLSNKNIETLTQYKEKVESLKEPEDITIQNMLRYQLELTINNLYTAKHSGGSKSVSEGATQEQIIDVLEANGVKETDETIDVTRKLILGNIPVTKINIEKFVNIQKTLKDLDMEELLISGAKEIKMGRKPEAMKIHENGLNQRTAMTDEDIKQMVEDLQYFDEKVIENTHAQNKLITIGNLQKTLYENVEKALGGVQEPSSQEEKITLTKRQIEEIRLKLTVEAALKLNRTLDIQTAPLHKVVEELKGLEEERYQEILGHMKAPITKENIEQMQKVDERIHTIKHHKEIAVAGIIEGDTPFTLEGMDEEIKVKRAQAVYDDVGTKPEGRFGEGIRRVEGQLEHILNLQEIETSSQNIKAAKALVQNNIEITKEKIEEAKMVLVKIETVLHELRPTVVAQMLREGIRPDTTHVDSLLQYVRDMKSESGQEKTQKLAEAILELDRTNQLGKEEKEGLIAVYRMLNTITKNETGATGFLLKNNKDLTLGNLFEASKYIKQLGSKTGKMDVTVDDDLGIRVSETPSNIRSLIEGATKGVDPDMAGGHNDVLNQWLSRMTPDELKKYMDWNKSLEEIQIQERKPSSLETEITTKQAKALDKISPQALTLLQDKNMPLTITNIYWIDKIIKNPFLLGDMLGQYENLTGEKIKSSVNHQGAGDIDEILDYLQKELEEQTPIQLSARQSTEAYTLGKDLDQMLNMQKQMGDNDSSYQIPVQLHHGISNLNIYVMKDKKRGAEQGTEELRAYMSIKTKNLGIIQVHMLISDKTLSFEMIGETPQITSNLKKGAGELAKAIENRGYNILQAKFSQGKFSNPMEDHSKTKISSLKSKMTDATFEYIV